ncbi:Nodulation protein nolG [Fibrisoma limi BUZ 3]|uniref:Nodulation protein nolG n=1 Tax=Fibrisoma limi BUZ 3 TaxID=1185876 RepID=I2GIX7_9BACT|nr:efflux RND transporter permease subunit [Fibrisoma limi]CCH53852.1 Nodulation protein nolG [Fibrisoma limi BUZ 3]
MKLAQLAINRPILIIVLFLVLGILGAFSYTQLRYELLPDISTPFVTVTTFYPGASPAEVENGLTKPVEDAVSTADRIKRITSQSLENASLIQVEFRQGSDHDRALQEVQRRVNEIVATLPADSKTPVVAKYSLSDLPVLRIAATSQLPDQAFGTLLKTQLKPRIAQTPGVGQVTFVGLPDTEVRVALDAARLKSLNLSVLQVVNAIRASNLNVPAGEIKDTDAAYSVRVVGKTDALDQLRNIVVFTDRSGANIRLGEVATIQTARKAIENINRFNRKATVGLLVTKQSGANNVEVSQAVRNLLSQFETEYKSTGLSFAIAQDASEFTLAAAEAVNHDLVLAVLLVALVMFVFLHSLRSSLIVMVAIPASLLSTFVVMNLLGFSLNLLTLLALSLVIGILVDDSIVVLESIYQQLERGKDKRTAALDGRTDIGFAAIAITLVDVVVFVPLSIAPGLIGDLMREFSLVVVSSTLFSLLVSFTLTPMIASRFGQLEHLSNKTLMGRFGLWFERGFDRLAAVYQDVLAWALGHRKTTALLAGGLFVASLTLPSMGFIGAEFTPPTDKGEVSITLQFAEGQKLAQTDALARQFEQTLYQMPEVRRVFTNVGSNPDSFGLTSGSNSVEFSVTFSPKNERTKDLVTLTQEVKQRAAQLPGVRIKAYPIGILGADGSTPIMLIVSGADRENVRSEATRIADAMRAIPGTADVRFSGQMRKPEVQIDVDREKLARYGLTTEEAGSAIRTALAGFDDLTIQPKDGSGLAGDQSVTMRIQYAESFRNRTEQLGRLSLLNAEGQLVELRQVADIRETFNPAVLERKDRNNAVTVTAQAVGRPVGDIGVDIQQAVAKLGIDPSVRIVYGGDLELQDDSFGKLGLAFGAAILFMYLIMVALYNSWLYPFVVLFSIPMAIVGALFALAFTMNSLNIFTILGLIMMLGLVAKNAILLVDRANQNREQGQPLVDALLEAGQNRLRPILMTTLAMVVGMLPIALATGPGAELKSGLAWALVGGLSSSMLLTLVFVPTVYMDFTRLLEWVNRRGAKGLGQGATGSGVGTKTVSAAIVLIVLSTCTLNAQPATPGPQPPALTPLPIAPRPLSLQQAADLVRAQNGDVRVAKMDIEKADVRLEEVKRSWWPTLNGVGQYTYNIKPPVFFFPAFSIDPATGSFSIDENRLQPVQAALRHGYSGAVNLAMPLVQPDLRIGRKQAATARQVASESLRAVTARQVTEVKKQYLNVLLAEEQRRLALRGIHRAQEALREARNLYRVQLATDADTLRAFVEVENQRPNLSKLERTIRLLRNQLSTLLGLKPDTELVLTDSLVYRPDAVAGEAITIGRAWNQRPELRQLALNLEQSQQQEQLDRTRRLPTLSLFGQVSTQAQLNDFRFQNSRWPLVLYAGLQLNIPLFNSTNALKIQQARIAYWQGQEQLRYNKELVANEVRSSLYAVDEARERIKTQDGVIRAVERSYGLFQSRYRQGLTRFSDLTDAELAFRQAQSNRLQAVYDYLVAQLDLERAIGVE